MFKKYIKINIIILIIISCSGCSIRNEKKNLFKEDTSDLVDSELFIINEEQIILKKSKFIKKNRYLKKIDLGSLK